MAGTGILLNGLSGIAQITFFHQPKIGAVFLLGIAIHSPYSALTCLVGAIIANFAAERMNYPPQKIREGLYGFNGALLGLALPIFLPNPLAVWICLLLGAFSTAILYKWMSWRGLPPLTFPYVLLTWFSIGLSGTQTRKSISEGTSIWEESIHGLGQIFFADSILTGLVILLGIGMVSWRYAIWVSIGAMLGVLPALWWTDDYVIAEGLISLNISLCFLALLHLQLVERKRYILVYGIITAALYLLFYVVLSSFTLPVLTFPFIISVWFAYFLRHFKMVGRMDISR